MRGGTNLGGSEDSSPFPKGKGVGRLGQAALAVLRNNRRTTRNPRTGAPCRYTCPSPGHYPFQWFWDSCFHAVALAHLEPEVAREELELLFSVQDASGFMPHVVFWERRRLWHPRLYWCWLQSRGRGFPRHTALIQPPVIAAAVERYVEITGDAGFGRQSLPHLDAYFAWLGRTRDADGTGLLSIVAPWESGMDHRPSYDAALGLRYPATPRELIIEPRMLDIVNRASGYNTRLLRNGRFVVQDTLVNAVYVDGLRSLARLHRATGDDATPWERQAARTEDAMLAHLRAPDGFFYDRDHRRARLLPSRTVAGLTALLLDGLSDDAAQPLLSRLSDPTEFGTPYPAPSVAASDPAFVPTAQYYGAGPILWRGPTWINLNWLLVRALRRRNHHALADTLRRSSIDLVLRSGFREHYNPLTGEGYGAHSFGWSTLVVDMLD
jgi:glycogen debranching enzyme